jgi:hypothetical protein
MWAGLFYNIPEYSSFRKMFPPDYAKYEKYVDSW